MILIFRNVEIRFYLFVKSFLAMLLFREKCVVSIERQFLWQCICDTSSESPILSTIKHLNVFGLLKRILLSNWTVIFYVLNNNFSYAQLASIFVSQKDSYYVHNDTDAFFSFLHQLNFDIFPEPFFAFCFFLLQINVDIFCLLLCWVFLYVFDKSCLSLFIYRKKNYKKYFFLCFKNYVSYMSFLWITKNRLKCFKYKN